MSTRSISVKAISAALVIAALGYVVSTHAATEATVTTDKNKYSLGDTMIVSGTGFTAGQGVSISVLRPDHLTDFVTGVVADGGGSFSTTYKSSDPQVPGRYKITATDGTNSANTASTQADQLGFDLAQCAQNDSKQGQPLGLGYCNWIGSALGQGNSHLFEGIATEQQVLITGITGSTHELIVGIESTKAGHHSYDFLVSDAALAGGDRTVDSTKNSEQASSQVGITLQLNRCGDSLGNQAKAACNALISTATMSPTANFNTVDISVPDDHYQSHDGDTQTRIDAYEAHFGDRTIRLYTDAPISGVTIALEHRAAKLSGAFGDGGANHLADGADTADTYIWYKINWTGNSQNALLVGAADIALGGDGTGRSWCAGCGATAIPGDPYHFFLVNFDGTGGAQDNQMSAGAIFTPPTPATTLTFKSQTPAGANVPVGTSVTIVVTETNTGNDTLTNVHVTGTGCTTWTPANVATFAPLATQDFTCTFTAVAGANPWTANALGTTSQGTPAPTTNESTSGSFTGLTTSTSLTLKSSTPANGSNAAVGGTATIVVTETNTGTASLTGVAVTPGGKCASFTGGATTLAAGASTDFTCTFTITAGANAWTADGVGTDQFGNPAPSTGEHQQGSLTGLTTSTSLTLKSSTPANGSNAAVGGTATIVVTETNTGTTSLTGVAVTPGGKCASFTGGATTLAAGASTDFTCTFTITAGANAWTADGVGTDQFGTPAPSTGEHQQGSLTGLTTSTSLTLKSSTPANGSNVAVGATVTIVVTETNTGTTSLTGVAVTPGGKCASFTGGATTLAAAASTDFTCTFTATAGANAWTADGVGTDQFGTPAPSTGEHQEGSFNGLTTSTSLTLKSSTPANGSNAAVGGTATIVVTETNTGTTSLTGVAVTPGGKCASFTGGATTLAAGASTDFTCTFTITAGANAWTADGIGTDQFGTPAPSAGEHQQGSLTGLTTSTSLTLKSSTPANGSNVEVGSTATIVVTETNTGTTSLTGVAVTPGGKCASFTGGATTLAAGASTDFTCTFTVTVGANAWTADGVGTNQFGTPAPSAGEHQQGSLTGLQSFLIINKLARNGSGTFGFSVVGPTASTPSVSATTPSGVNFTGTTGSFAIHTGSYLVKETTLPSAQWSLTAFSCTVDGTNNFGAATGQPLGEWGFTIPLGTTVTCNYDNTLAISNTTRTQGFWATHTGLANAVWNGVPGPSGTNTPPKGPVPANLALVCNVTVTAIDSPAGKNLLMGGFWSSLSKVSTAKGNGGTRTDADQARMQMLQQYLAAVLNYVEFGSLPDTFGTTLEGALAVYCDPNATAAAIRTKAGQLGAFNESGDSGLFTPGINGTPAASKSQADLDFWDDPDLHTTWVP